MRSTLGGMEFQSTHPHGVRLNQRDHINGWIPISIHAPARGATPAGPPPSSKSDHFNPRTRTGCDDNELRKADLDWNFNPRTRTGCDTAVNQFVITLEDFNPRTRTGCDDVMIDVRLDVLFQSTHPHGVRPQFSCVLVIKWYFNPRTRTGCDLGNRVRIVQPEISIHAPARGATLDMFHYAVMTDISIHAPARGATSMSLLMIGQANRFQSTHPHGVRPGRRWKTFRRQFISIHAPARGATPVPEIKRIESGISIHAPARGATLR